MILVDTTIWSKAFRRRRTDSGDPGVQELLNILDMEAELLIGPVRQELLSGISNKMVFDDLSAKLDGFNNYEVQIADHNLAAEYYNVCLTKGIQGSQTDYLICAVASRYDMEIFTEDKDFSHYKKYLPIRLY